MFFFDNNCINSDDFNAPNEELCMKFLDKAVSSGINFLDTAEQYPIPSSAKNPEGATEALIGKWLSLHPKKRKDIVIATKITGGRNVNKDNIVKDCEGITELLSSSNIAYSQMNKMIMAISLSRQSSKAENGLH